MNFIIEVVVRDRFHCIMQSLHYHILQWDIIFSHLQIMITQKKGGLMKVRYACN